MLEEDEVTLTFRVQIFTVFLAIVAIAMPAFAEQYCSDEGHARSFEQRDDGIAIDRQRGLMWMRCAYGQRWNAGRCEHNAETFTWKEAQMEIARFNDEGGAYGFIDWRLPTIEELQSLVVPGCEDPALDTRVFPDAPVTAYWTSTFDPVYEPGVMLVHFVNGRVYMGNRAVHWAMRLVRQS